MSWSMRLILLVAFGTASPSSASELDLPLGVAEEHPESFDVGTVELDGDHTFATPLISMESPPAGSGTTRIGDWTDPEWVKQLLTRPTAEQARVWTERMLQGGTFGRYHAYCALLDNSLLRHFNGFCERLRLGDPLTLEERRFVTTYGAYNRKMRRMAISMFIGFVPGEVGMILGIADKAERVIRWLRDHYFPDHGAWP